MKLLRCLICHGEIDIIDTSSPNKKVKCQQCGFTNLPESKSEPEVFIRRRIIPEDKL